MQGVTRQLANSSTKYYTVLAQAIAHAPTPTLTFALYYVLEHSNDDLVPVLSCTAASSAMPMDLKRRRDDEHTRRPPYSISRPMQFSLGRKIYPPK